MSTEEVQNRYNFFPFIIWSHFLPLFCLIMVSFPWVILAIFCFTSFSPFLLLSTLSSVHIFKSCSHIMVPMCFLFDSYLFSLSCLFPTIPLHTPPCVYENNTVWKLLSKCNSGHCYLCLTFLISFLSPFAPTQPPQNPSIPTKGSNILPVF